MIVCFSSRLLTMSCSPTESTDSKEANIFKTDKKLMPAKTRRQYDWG